MPGGPVLMTVLDAYAIIAYLRAERSSAEVARLLRRPTRLTAVNAAEVCDQMVRVFGSDPDAVEADLALLGHAGMALVPVSPEMATEAGRIRARRSATACHHGPGSCHCCPGRGRRHPSPSRQQRAAPVTAAVARQRGVCRDRWLSAEPGILRGAQDIGQRGPWQGRSRPRRATVRSA